MALLTSGKPDSAHARAPSASGPPEFAEFVLGPMNDLGDTTTTFEGSTINVGGGIPGERVVARIHRYRRRRKPIVSGVVVQVLRPSRYRVQTRCGYCGPCSGCQWQHIDYSHQLELKREAVARQLRRYDRLSAVDVRDTVSTPQQFYYRNHARFTVRRGGQLGFSNRITRRFVRIEHCMLMDPSINEALVEFQDKAAETTNMSVRVGVNTGERLIQPTFQNPDIRIASGQTHYTEKMSNHRLRVASPSFFQVNTPQAERMVHMVREGLRLSGDDVLVDAYAGVGVFAILLAQSVSKSVAIEESAAAIVDAKANALGVPNIEFVQEKTEDALGGLGERFGLRGKDTAIVLDPPRVGCHPRAIASLVSLAPSRVAYVSCDPPSLARDLDQLTAGGYEVESVQPVDMFPQTYHVESVTILELSGQA